MLSFSFPLSSSQYKMSPIKITLIGATGNLCACVLEALLGADICVTSSLVTRNISFSQNNLPPANFFSQTA
jgi:hypothetical protein